MCVSMSECELANLCVCTFLMCGCIRERHRERESALIIMCMQARVDSILEQMYLCAMRQ